MACPILAVLERGDPIELAGRASASSSAKWLQWLFHVTTGLRPENPKTGAPHVRGLIYVFAVSLCIGATPTAGDADEFDQISERLTAVIKTMPNSSKEFEKVLVQLESDETFPTPLGTEYDTKREDDQAAIESFANKYKIILDTRNAPPDIDQDRSFAELIRPMLDKSLSTVVPLLTQGQTPEIKIIVDLNNRNSVLVRRAAIGDLFIVSIGVDFLRSLSEDVTALSAFLLRNFMS